VEGYYIAAGAAAVWAVILTAIGVRNERFPSTPRATRLVAAVSIVLVLATIGLAIYLSANEEHEKGGEEHATLDRI
jgi:hypothetical protein